MLRKTIISILILFVTIVSTVAYFYLWPRYLFTSYGFHDVAIETNHGEWWIRLNNSPVTKSPRLDFSKWWVRVFPRFNKVNIDGPPYYFDIYHDPSITIRSVEILKWKKIVFSSKELKQIPHKRNTEKDSILTRCDNIVFDYGDCQAVIYYSRNEQDTVTDYFIKAMLRTNFTEDKVSLFDIDQGI